MNLRIITLCTLLGISAPTYSSMSGSHDATTRTISRLAILGGFAYGGYHIMKGIVCWGVRANIVRDIESHLNKAQTIVDRALQDLQPAIRLLENKNIFELKEAELDLLVANPQLLACIKWCEEYQLSLEGFTRSQYLPSNNRNVLECARKKMGEYCNYKSDYFSESQHKANLESLCTRAQKLLDQLETLCALCKQLEHVECYKKNMDYVNEYSVISHASIDQLIVRHAADNYPYISLACYVSNARKNLEANLLKLHSYCPILCQRIKQLKQSIEERIEQLLKHPHYITQNGQYHTQQTIESAEASRKAQEDARIRLEQQKAEERLRIEREKLWLEQEKLRFEERKHNDYMAHARR